MKIAVVGSGIAGLASAWLLSHRHDVVLFEANDYLGGHTHTHDMTDGSAVDTGFIVFNDRTYPLFNRLIGQLGVAWQDTDMSFGYWCQRTGLQYAGDNLNTLFARQRLARTMPGETGAMAALRLTGMGL